MKKAAIALFALLLTSVAWAADKPTLIFGGVGEEMKSSGQTAMFPDMMKAVSGAANVNIEIKWFNSDEELTKAMEKGTVDIILMIDMGPYIVAMKKTEFTPIASYTIFKQKDMRGCLFVNSSVKATKLEEIKGMKASVYMTDFEYYLMRKLIGTKPAGFFGKTRANKRGMFILKDIAVEKEMPVGFVYDVNLNLLKMANPTSLKDIRPLVCADPVPHPAISVSKKLPKDIVDKMKSFILNAHKEPSMKRFHPLMKQFGLKFLPADSDALKKATALYDTALKNGWDKEYEQWLKGVEIVKVRKDL